MKIGLVVERGAGKSRKHSVFQWFWRVQSQDLDLGTRQNHGGLCFFPFRTSICWRYYPKSIHKLVYKTASLSTTSPFSHTNGAGSRAWCREVMKTLCFAMVLACSKAINAFGNTPKPWRVALFHISDQHLIKVSSTFVFLVPKSQLDTKWYRTKISRSMLTQSDTEQRFQGPSTRKREFLVRGGTESSQEPKECEGFQNRPSTGPFQNMPGVP